jgi:hypothetical protein
VIEQCDIKQPKLAYISYLGISQQIFGTYVPAYKCKYTITVMRDLAYSMHKLVLKQAYN